ncbi:hypothetical protein L1987_63632 [Smallanthus sonchifolius]|uniref:Uncharacterized protein n=1 Tax=Smallanthus sonchifolius TaxID=185202 RepID=A0ACB9CDT3_9ASTR|nr:hypothetical protein L1987_63632 [Smallanthus sonchifolius]
MPLPKSPFTDSQGHSSHPSVCHTSSVGKPVQESILPMLVKESLKALGGLGLLSLGGKFLLRRVFEVVAEERSSKAFVALCLLTVTGTSLITQKLGFSDTLRAFLAGALLAETNFRTQIKAHKAFRGITSWVILCDDLNIYRYAVTFPRMGECIVTVSRFNFFSLANRLRVLPLELNKLLIIVVVLPMALTPLLNDLGRKAADFIGENIDKEDKPAEVVNFDATDPVVILGFGQMSEVLANFLSTPLANGIDGDVGWPFVAFELDPSVEKERNDPNLIICLSKCNK